MNPCRVFLAVALALSGTAVPAHASRLIRIPQEEILRVAELGIAPEPAIPVNGWLEVVVSEEEAAKLESQGISQKTVIADLEAEFEARSAAEGDLWQGRSGERGFDYGSMGGYYTYDEVAAKLDEMRQEYPDLITARASLGTTQEGREVWMAKISDNADQSEGEPAILLTGLTHAREPMGMTVTIYYAFYLLERYGTDPEVTYLVDEREIYIVPVVNPDGYVRNQTTNPNGGGNWRKNRRDNGDGTFGVDLNRNYGYLWGYDNSGSSPIPGDGTYRGPGPFSEPETSAIRSFCVGRGVSTAYHFHAYGNHTIHPFAYSSAAYPPEPDLSVYQSYAAALTRFNGYDVGNFFDTLHYVANGESLDWSYGEQQEKAKIFAFLNEIGTSFWPSPSSIIPLCEQNLPPSLYLTWVAGARVDLAGVDAPEEVLGGSWAGATVEVANGGCGGTATDATVSLTTTDPYITIPDSSMQFPEVPPLGSVTGDPIRFFVASDTPDGHIAELTVTLHQGPITMAGTGFSVTVANPTFVADAVAAGPWSLSVAPNPLTRDGRIEMVRPRNGVFSLEVYDAAGRLCRVLSRDSAPAGRREVTFDGRDDAGRPLPAGTYFVTLRDGPVRRSCTLTILR